ncbi:ParB N-terminal domain-containing protein [Nostoc sp.]|uniref:ParB N-terminal domain-containing protein n=1 Tax=Nostoc sp. TaxID=1180 RepID=UPI002FFA6794
MLLSVSFVPVKQITSSVPRSNFPENELNHVAELILKGEGIINPLILRSTSLESYEVVDGHFEYYAAARAREINLRKGEMIGAFIIESNNQESIEQQIKLLRMPNSGTSSNVSPVSDGIESPLINTESRFINTESRMTNLESRFENRTIELQREFRLEIKNINDRLKEIENRIPKPMEPLEALNTLSLSELTSKLRRVGINIKIIEKIISERDNGKFKSFSNVVDRIKGLGDKTMLKIIDSFAEGTV